MDEEDGPDMSVVGDSEGNGDWKEGGGPSLRIGQSAVWDVFTGGTSHRDLSRVSWRLMYATAW